MTTITNTQTLDALRNLGCLADDTIDAPRIAKLLAERLEHDHIAGSLDDVATVQATVGQLASDLIGHDDPDFIEMLRPLLSAGYNGKVQKALSNGYMLCAGRVKIDININGELKHASMTTRFLSADPDVLQLYVLEPRIKRAENLAESSIALRDLVATRQPGMAEQLGTFTERLTITWQRALGTGEAS